MSVQEIVDSIGKTGGVSLRLRLKVACTFLISITLLAAFAAPIGAAGAVQISGVGAFAAEGECLDQVTGPEGQSPDFASKLTGDLEGCVYVFVETYECRPSGTYIETGTEIYVGGGGEGDHGTLSTTYRFTAKFADCANLTGQIFGRCQHPIMAGTGTGDYAGVTGRLDFKDDIEAGNFPYTGPLRW